MKALSRRCTSLPFTSHWPECSHMAVHICKGGWVMLSPRTHMLTTNRRLDKGRKGIGSKSTISHRMTKKDLYDWVTSLLSLTSHHSPVNFTHSISAVLNCLHFPKHTKLHTMSSSPCPVEPLHSFSFQLLPSHLCLQPHPLWEFHVPLQSSSKHHSILYFPLM